MAQLNVSNLNAILQSFSGHLQQIEGKSPIYQDAVNALTDQFSKIDGAIVGIIESPDPGPRADLDFSLLDAAVEAFKASARIGQTDANSVAGLVKQNTPQS